MSHLISLYVLDRIFDGASQNLPSGAKSLYINCLSHHFRNRKANVVNATAFEIFISEIPKFEKFRRSFERLHSSGLVVLSSDRVCFINTWGQHIDRRMLENVSPFEYVGGFNFGGVEQHEEELRQNQMLHESIRLRYSVSEEQIFKLAEVFIREQKAFNKKYNGWADCSRHFLYWIGHRPEVSAIKREPQQFVKSKGKILGR